MILSKIRNLLIADDTKLSGNSLVTFELLPEGEKTLLRLTHSGIESFPDDKDFARTSFGKGWTQLIGTNLEDCVEKKRNKSSGRVMDSFAWGTKNVLWLFSGTRLRYLFVV